jgi:hypothetical protein
LRIKEQKTRLILHEDAAAAADDDDDICTQSNTTMYFLPYWLLVSPITTIFRPILYEILKMLVAYSV